MQIQLWHRQSDASKKLAQIPGIGAITASALVVSIGDAKNFENGRQLAAWLGLVSRQHSSGGKHTFLGISQTWRCLPAHVAHPPGTAVIRVAQNKADQSSSWLAKVMERRNKNVAAVALANKNARLVWMLLAHEKELRADYATVKAAT